MFNTTNTQKRFLPFGVLWLIFTVCVGVELTLSAADFGLVGTPAWRGFVYQNGGFWPGLWRDWQPNFPAQPYLMIVSHGFLHGGISHTAFNMIALFSLGAPVVSRVGPRLFIVLYMVSMLGGALGFGLLTREIQPMVGASGALFGLVGAIAAWGFSDRKRAHLGMWPIRKMVLMLLVLNLVLFWVLDGQLAWEAHLGGFLAGLILAPLINRSPAGV